MIKIFSQTSAKKLASPVTTGPPITGCRWASKQFFSQTPPQPAKASGNQRQRSGKPARIYRETSAKLARKTVIEYIYFMYFQYVTFLLFFSFTLPLSEPQIFRDKSGK